jgi:hypothetical protein
MCIVIQRNAQLTNLLYCRGSVTIKSNIINYCWWGDLRERDYCGNPGVVGRIILR